MPPPPTGGRFRSARPGRMRVAADGRGRLVRRIRRTTRSVEGPVMTALRPTLRERLAAQEAEDRARAHDLHERPNVPPDQRAPHPWDVTPQDPCVFGRSQHDYTR